MVQTVRTVRLIPAEKTILFEKPHVLRRVFFSVRQVSGSNNWAPSAISFGDPQFLSYYEITAVSNYFQAKGNDIFQGDIWLQNNAAEFQYYTSTEILH